MANLNKTAARKLLPHVGVSGNMSVKTMTWTGDAAQNDVVYMGWVPANSFIYRFTLTNTALGATVTAKAGYVKVDAAGSMTDDDDAFFAATSVTAAGNIEYLDAAGVNVTEDAFIVITLEGANPASGTLDVLVEYNHERK